MGISCMKSCLTNLDWRVKAPNPSPSSYIVLEKSFYNHATFLKVKYIGCTNFEGIKLLVYKGHFIPDGDLDPHFQENGNGPIARFEPTKEGWCLANSFAKRLGTV